MGYHMQQVILIKKMTKILKNLPQVQRIVPKKKLKMNLRQNIKKILSQQ